ncbi:MAG: hypothetical protein Q4A34_02755 [Candidatus Saccharibacteria bacterium]|nr:hypothetical protein [Candidatus Saccharibacteria bacterium]
MGKQLRVPVEVAVIGENVVVSLKPSRKSRRIISEAAQPFRRQLSGDSSFIPSEMLLYWRKCGNSIDFELLDDQTKPLDLLQEVLRIITDAVVSRGLSLTIAGALELVTVELIIDGSADTDTPGTAMDEFKKSIDIAA